MPLKVAIRRDTKTLWITGTVKPPCMDRGFRIRKRASSNDVARAELEASYIENEILNAHPGPPRVARKASVAFLPPRKPTAPPSAETGAAPRRRGYRSLVSRVPGSNHAEPNVCIYVMEAGCHVKVGLASDLFKRLRQIRASSPISVILVDSMPIRADVAGWCEHLAHTALAKHHSHYEWFKCCPDDALAAVRIAVEEAIKVPAQWVSSGHDPRDWERQCQLMEGFRGILAKPA